MRVRTAITGILGIGIIIGVLVGVWYLVYEQPPKYCQLSGRLIHPHMLTTILVNGRRLYACCARCAFTYEQQTRKNVQILYVTDYLSGKRIDAGKAYFVDGSHVEPCCSPAVQSEAERTPYIRMFDRCSPSLLAFTNQSDATAFVTRNGGRVATLDELQHQMKSSAQEIHP
jgi:nitrous oxide reductase accessory protein NosL